MQKGSDISKRAKGSKGIREFGGRYVSEAASGNQSADWLALWRQWVILRLLRTVIQVKTKVIRS